MGDLDIGYTWNSGDTASPTKLNDAVNLATIKNGAVTAAKLAATQDLSGKTDVILPPAAISGRPAITSVADDDYFLVLDTSTGLLSKVAKANVSGVPTGGVLQTLFISNASRVALTTAIPFSTSAPTDALGTLINTLAITVAATANKVRVTANAMCGINVGTARHFTMLVFRGTTLVQVSSTFTNYPDLKVDFIDSPATAGVVTYKVHVAAEVTTAFLNGDTSATNWGGGAKACLTLQELKG